MKKTVDKIPFYRLGWNKTIYATSHVLIFLNYFEFKFPAIQKFILSIPIKCQ
jgi:hypothetical protein